jgi:endonuclease I
MTKRTYLLSTLIVLFLGLGINASAIDRQALAKYAASLNGKKGAELKTALQPLLKPKKVLGYGSGNGNTWSGFYKTDRNPKNNECYNRYSSEKFFFTSTTKAISGMNIEHSFPKSWWGGGTKYDAYKDLYHLYPSPSTGNSQKSNYPMDEVTNATIEEEGYDKIGTGKNVNSRAWEPGDRFKGDFARTYMYMAVAYGDLTFSEDGQKTMNNEAYPGLKPWASALYCKWSSADRVDSLERARNNAVALIEGNRNLFIDYPYLAEYVWGDSVDVAFDPTTSISTASDDDRYLQGGSNPDEPTTPDVPVDDDVYYFSLADHVVSDSLYLIVSDNGGSLLAMQMLSGTKTYGYPGTVDVKMVNDTISLSSLENTFKITADGKIIDSKGRYVWHEGSYKTISMTAAGNSKGSWTITKNSDGTFKIAFADNYYIQYSPTYKSYGCYLDAQGLMPKLFVRVNKNVTPTAIVSVVDNGLRQRNGNIYTVEGRLVGKDASVLAPGLYIRDGKKFVVR